MFVCCRCRLAPQFVDVRHMTDHVTSTTGSTEQLACSAVGVPAPQIVWYRDGVLLDDADHDEEDLIVVDSQHDVTSRKLILRHVTPADSGQYRCTAFNHVGNVSFNYNLHVVGQSTSPQRSFTPDATHTPPTTHPM